MEIKPKSKSIKKKKVNIFYLFILLENARGNDARKKNERIVYNGMIKWPFFAIAQRKRKKT